MNEKSFKLGMRPIMKTKIFLIIVATILIGVCPAQADTVWLSGHHEIFEDDIFGEIWMYNDATADMFGGDVFKLETFNISSFDMYGGEMDLLTTHDDSIISIYDGEIMGRLDTFDDSIINVFSGSLVGLGAVNNSLINIYAYDVVHHPTGGSNYNGWVEGKYLANDLYFSFSLLQQDSFSHINVVPEPCSVLLLGIGSLILKKRTKR